MQVQLEVFYLEIVFTLFIKVFHNLLSYEFMKSLSCIPSVALLFFFSLSSFQGAV